ncbi:uncharacterized protein LOC111633364 [Centruroides sculpturatus]|uniref:uncharacterized protein LOC111633364 n=1 Tax=Centruroides sculpturatus TaxID=218467 RepID=UPI000C6E4F32|nr:uncharacterized protein LOC111633364 [Centruroides sculpturatus]
MASNFQEFACIECNDGDVMVWKPLLERNSSTLKDAIVYFCTMTSKLKVDCMRGDFIQIITYLVSNELHLSSIKNGLNIYRLGSIFKIEEIKDICRNYIIHHVDIENICYIHDFACEHEDYSIQYHCWIQFDRHCQEILDSEGFLSCKHTTISRFVSRPIYTSLKEENLFQAAVKWAKRRYLDELNQSTSVEELLKIKVETIRNNLIPYLTKIRLLTLDLETLENHIFTENVLTADEMNSLRCLCKNIHTYCAVPPTICNSDKPRKDVVYNSLIHYEYKYNIDHDERIKLDDSYKFQGRFYAEEDCFLLGLNLPITHEKPITFMVDVVPESSEAKVIKKKLMTCDENGLIKLENPIFVVNYSFVTVFAKFVQENSDIWINCHSYFIVDTTLRWKDKKINEDKFKILYMNVALYF